MSPCDRNQLKRAHPAERFFLVVIPAERSERRDPEASGEMLRLIFALRAYASSAWSSNDVVGITLPLKIVIRPFAGKVTDWLVQRGDLSLSDQLQPGVFGQHRDTEVARLVEFRPGVRTCDHIIRLL